MRKYLYVVFMAMLVTLLSSCKGTNPSNGSEILSIRDLSLPESAFPDSVTWDPHPPTGDSEYCWISSNLFITQDTGIIHCFCSNLVGMPDSITQSVTALLLEYLYHEGEIGIFIFEFQDSSDALNGINFLRGSIWNDERSIFLTKQVFDIWIWCDEEDDTTGVNEIKDYYVNHWGFGE